MRTAPRMLPLLGTAAALVAGPILGATVLAGEPTIVVQPGDTLSQLALNHGVGVEQLVAVNGLDDPDRIYVGQRLSLAPDTTAPAPLSPAVPASSTHVVARGENLTWIARRYGTTVEAIVAANGITNPRLILAGQQLSIPGEPAAPAPADPPPAPAPATAQPITHVVASGENLTWIARRYGTAVETLVAANGITNPRLIFAGQQLVVPAATTPASAGASAPATTPERDVVRQMVVEEAGRFGVPAAFALAVAWQESGWRQDARSSAGAVGVMQLLPATAEWVGAVILGEPVDITDARSNIRAGVSLLAHYLARYGSRELALAAYYQGQAGTDRHGVYPSSRLYVDSILALEAAFGS
ncbi:MAG: lytic transglycosylase [Candidatus Limnocylindria bacterium]